MALYFEIFETMSKNFQLFKVQTVNESVLYLRTVHFEHILKSPVSRSVCAAGEWWGYICLLTCSSVWEISCPSHIHKGYCRIIMT